MFRVIITNEVSVTVLQAYMSLPRHIRQGVVIRQIIAPGLCNTEVDCQQFRKESRKRQRRFERDNSFFHHFLSVVLSLSDIPKTVF